MDRQWTEHSSEQNKKQDSVRIIDLWALEERIIIGIPFEIRSLLEHALNYMKLSSYFVFDLEYIHSFRNKCNLYNESQISNEFQMWSCNPILYLHFNDANVQSN